MASTRIVWWVLTLAVLASFYLPVTKGQSRCRFYRGCYICRYQKPTKENCLAYRYCYSRTHGYEHPVCIERGHHQVDRRVCGIVPTKRIVGGVQSREGDWPWQVSLQTRNFIHICGGALIDHYWILTAGHCVRGTNASELIAVVGEFDLGRRTPHEHYYRIRKINVHPYFHSGGNFPNDVALLQLEKYVYYTEYISPICLPSINENYQLKGCSITGWGETRGTGDKHRLRVLQVNLLAPRECARYWYGNINNRLHLCINYGLTGACSGDSGGPLNCFRNSDGRFVLAGVTSWGDRSCHRAGFPSIYTNIRSFVPWINFTMKSNT